MVSAFASLSNSVADAVERGSQVVLFVREGGRFGVSGTIWRDDLAITAEHTIRGHQQLSLVLPSGADSTATVIGRDPSTDIALLRLAHSPGTTPEFLDPAKLRVGQLVLAVGRRPADGVVASPGMIGALGGEWRGWRGGRVDRWFRLELTPFTGFSGGPLIDAEGRVIGMNTSGPRRSVISLPTKTVNRVVELLLTSGHIKRGFIGVALQPVPIHRKTGPGGKADRGLLTVMVEPESPAERAGLIAGDIVIGLSGQPLTSPQDLQSVLDAEQIGKTISLQILRGGKSQDVPVVIAEREEETPSTP